MFYELQSKEKRNLYIRLLGAIGSLSNLFSNSESPYLSYRVMENAFCMAFNAKNFARSDVSIDVGIGKIGIGLKTFIQKNGKTFQKIAEFNKNSDCIKKLSARDKVYEIARMRNARLDTTRNICKTENEMYHLVTRNRYSFGIYEENMDFINIDKIKITGTTEKALYFCDDKNEYNFNISKSTLYKRFYTTKDKLLERIDVKILEDPFKLLLGLDLAENVSSALNIQDEAINLLTPCSSKAKRISG